MFFAALTARSELLIKPDAALKLRFGDSTEITKKNIALTSEQLNSIRKKVRWAVEEKIYTLYQVQDSDQTLKGYAVLVSDLIRTHNQTILFFIDTKGTLQGAELIAYYEPPEYQVNKKWMEKNLKGKTSQSTLESGDDLPVVTGSTLTTQSMARSARLALALWEITFAKTPESK